MKLKKKTSVSVSGVVRNLSEMRFIPFFWIPRNLYVLGPVSRKSRNFTGHFRVSHFPLCLKIGEDLKSSNFFLLP